MSTHWFMTGKPWSARRSQARADAGVGTDGAAGIDGGVGMNSATGTDAEVADTWSSFAEDFFASYCVECHSAGSARDYTRYERIVTDGDRIRCGVATTQLDGCSAGPVPRQFPVGSGAKPSDEERDRLVAWIDMGFAE